jgi:Fe-S cluster assembly protein SufD|tara:strand:- start:1744 stop:3084 length:1341 start_codon:yes stop_codon:yes gene_type:complete
VPDGAGRSFTFLEQAAIADQIDTGSQPHWLRELKESGASIFKKRGLPNRSDEYWRHTLLNQLVEIEFQLSNESPRVGQKQLSQVALAGLSSYRIVLVNGCVRKDLSSIGDLPKGVLIAGFNDVMSLLPNRLEKQLGHYIDLKNMPMAALNTAFLKEGVIIFVDKDITVDKPIELISITVPNKNPTMSQPRFLIDLGENSRATLIESHIGNTEIPYFNNVVSEIIIGEGAGLDHYKFQDEGTAAVHISTTALRLHKQSLYGGFILQSGGLIGRVEASAVLDGSDSDCRFDGVYLGRDNQLLDTTTSIKHVATSCKSRQVFKGVLNGNSHGVFQGKTHVSIGAQKTDGYQLSRALLLSRDAEISTKPELEIYADDVKCSHGATSGDLDADSLFYLQSRGLSPDVARRVLVEAFLNEALAEIKLNEVYEGFRSHIRGWLNKNINQTVAE